MLSLFRCAFTDIPRLFYGDGSLHKHQSHPLNLFTSSQPPSSNCYISHLSSLSKLSSNLLVPTLTWNFNCLRIPCKPNTNVLFASPWKEPLKLHIILFWNIFRIVLISMSLLSNHWLCVLGCYSSQGKLRIEEKLGKFPQHCQPLRAWHYYFHNCQHLPSELHFLLELKKYQHVPWSKPNVKG